jgi:protocatechuate 3,4-dioxygenase alpha subunit
VSTYVTPSQTVGPYFAMRLPWPEGPHVVPPDTPGAITIFGRIYDGVGNVIPDGMVETWQADPDGRFAHPDDPRGPVPNGYHGFRGFGRCETAPDGSFTIVTLRPGPFPALGKRGGEAGGEIEAPHLNVSVFARGMLDRCVTRMYFPDEKKANAADPVLSTVPPERRSTLIARSAGDGKLRWDIHLQGDLETVFFDV